MGDATELLVPRRTSCFSPVTCDVSREGDRGPEDQLNPGEAGVEAVDVGVAHGNVDEGSS